MKTWLIQVSLLILAAIGHADYIPEPNLEIPVWFEGGEDILPVNYLASIRVENTSEILGKEKKEKLFKLFLSASKASFKRTGQDYPLSTSTPIYRLLRKNCPAVIKIEREGGNVVFLGDIAKELKTPTEKMSQPATR